MSTFVKIGDFCKTGSGGTPSRSKQSLYYGGGIPWVKSGELKEGVITSTDETVTELAIAESSIKLIPQNALLVAMYGATIGRVAQLGIEATSNQAVCYIIPDDNKCNRRYLFHALCSKSPEWIAKGAGGAQPNISQGIIRETKIPLPPLAEQKRIAAILDKADAIRKKRKQAIELTEQLLRATFLEMFGDPVTNPKGWERKKFGELITTLTDYHANGSYEILKKNVDLLSHPDHALMVRTTDLENNSYDSDNIYISEVAYNFLAKTKVYGGELIMNKIGSAGNVYFMPELSRPVSLGMNAFLIRTLDFVQNLYVYHFLHTDFGRNNILKRVQGAVTKTIKKDAVRDIPILLPPPHLQNVFVSYVQKIEASKKKMQQYLKELDDNFHGLMQLAFKGEL